MINKENFYWKELSRKAEQLGAYLPKWLELRFIVKKWFQLFLVTKALGGLETLKLARKALS